MFDIQGTPITEDCVARKISSNMMSYLGELFQIRYIKTQIPYLIRYREKATTSRPTLSASVELYFRSSTLYPYEGKYFMLISSKY